MQMHLHKQVRQICASSYGQKINNRHFTMNASCVILNRSVKFKPIDANYIVSMIKQSYWNILKSQQS